MIVFPCPFYYPHGVSLPALIVIIRVFPGIIALLPNTEPLSPTIRTLLPRAIALKQLSDYW